MERLETQPELTRLETTDSRWLALVGSHPEASPFHHPAWIRTIEETYGWRSFVLAEVGQDGALRAGVPVVEVANPLRSRRWVSLPYVDSCPPLVLGDDVRLAEGLAGASARAGIATFEVRADVDGPGVYTSSDWVQHVLALSGDVDAHMRGLHGMTRRNVRIAEREGVEVRRGEGLTSLTETFYELHVETRRRLGVPVQPRRFFRVLWRELMERDLGFVLIAYHLGEPVAAAVFLAYNRRLVYKYGASSVASLHVRPNNLLFWSVIRWAAEEGYESLDFGRTEVSQQGLRSFKAGWGAVEEPLVYTFLADRAPTASAPRVSGLVAPLIRRSPAWVTRALGEVFYRYAA